MAEQSEKATVRIETKAERSGVLPGVQLSRSFQSLRSNVVTCSIVCLPSAMQRLETSPARRNPNSRCNAHDLSLPSK